MKREAFVLCMGTVPLLPTPVVGNTFMGKLSNVGLKLNVMQQCRLICCQDGRSSLICMGQAAEGSAYGKLHFHK